MPEIVAGLWDVSREAYHADRTALCNSALADFRKSVPLYYGRHVTGTIPPKESTDAMSLGTLLHTLVLEPENFAASVAVAPEINRRTNAGKEEYAAWCAASACKTVVTREQLDTAQRMAASIRLHQMAGYALSLEGPVEQAIRWQDPKTGLWIRNLIDKWAPSIGLVIDLKTSRDPTPTEFAKSVANLGYHAQAALYSDGAAAVYGETVDFLFIVVGSEPPHEVACYTLDEAAIEAGRRANRAALDEIARRRESGEWQSRYQQIETISLPFWALRNEA